MRKADLQSTFTAIANGVTGIAWHSDPRAVDKSRPIHFVGIGGCSMSGLALMLHHQGYIVTGSDSVSSANTDRVAEAGIKVDIGHRQENVSPGTQLVVVTSAAVAPDNVELVMARATGIRIIDRAEQLGAMMAASPQGIAIAGTSGKTTTTSLIGSVMQACGLDPTVAVGTRAGDFHGGGNFILGRGQYFVSEACEYHNAFRYMIPDMAVVLNIYHDHGDFFTDGIGQIVRVFEEFTAQIKPGGVLLVSQDCPRARHLQPGPGVRKVTFGFSERADYRIGDVTWAGGTPKFEIGARGHPRVRLTPTLPGEHNMINLAAAFALASELGLPHDKVIPALNAFTGAPRRLEYQGDVEGIQMWDDLACSTGETTATMNTLRGLAQGARITVVLRPNSFSRVRDNFAEYAGVFTNSEHVIVTDIFPGRDKETFGQHARALVADMTALGRDVVYVPDVGGQPARDAIFSELDAYLRSGDALATIGPLDLAGLAADYRNHRRARWYEEDFAV